MSLYEDSRVCTGCGRTTFTRHTCPFCPCNFCKKEGHIADDCDRLKRRKEKSQQIGSSPLDTSLLRKRRLDFDSENTRKKSATNATTVARNSSLFPTGNRSSAGNDANQLLDPEILQLGSVTTVLPQLEPLAVHILGKILSEECPDTYKHYQGKIDEYGGPKIVLNDMMEAVDTQFQALQGKEVTLEALREIQRNQALDESLWDVEGGYLSCITDKRCPFYFRLYDGQATILSKRIASHVMKMASGDTSTLHYYVKSMGGTYREANFLRNFHIQFSKRSQEDRDLLKNLLELEMCVALRTLPQKELAQWLPPGSPAIKFPSVHLNVANPLIQGSINSESGRQSSRNLLLDSADPEVRQWPAVRGSQLAAQGRSTTMVPYVPLADYAPIFNNAVQANSHKLGQLECFDPELKVPIDESFWHSGCLEKCGDAISRYLGRVVPVVRPSGRLESRIAIIVNGVETSRSGDKSGSSSITEQKDQFVPYGLREMGLNAENTLSWPFNLRQSGMSRPDEMSTELAAVEAAHFKDYSLSLIAASGARFILICDGIQQRHLFDQAQGLSPPIEITLRSYKVLFRLMLDGTKIQRAFVVIPDPKKLMRGGNWRSTQKFAQIVRLVTKNNRAYASIFRAVAEEKALGTPLTIQLLDCWVRQWLSRKGFETNEDIEELIKIVGSLTDGLFVLLCCLPKRHVVRNVRFHEKSVTRGPKHSKELLSAVRKLQSEKVRKNPNCSDLDEDDHDKVPDIVQVNISQETLGQPTDGNEGQDGSGDEQDDDSDASNDEPASMMEFSLDTTDDTQINIAEIHDNAMYQRLRESRSQASRKAAETYRARLMRKLYEGSISTTLRRIPSYSSSDRYQVNAFLFRFTLPASIDVDHLSAAILKAELVDRGSKQPITKRLAMSDKATATAQRLAISVTVCAKDGSIAQFWAQKSDLKAAGHALDLVPQLEAVQEELATELSQSSLTR